MRSSPAFRSLFLRGSLVLIAVVFAAGSVGCSQFLNGKKKEEQIIELSDSKFEGLKDLPETLKRFTSGDATPEEIEKSFKTLEDALIYFRKRTKGSGDDSYTAEDLRKFFGKYFLKENNVSPELAKALMKLKKALFGGSEIDLTKAELDRMVRILGILRVEFVKISPHMKMLLFQKDKGAVSSDEIKAAMAQLRSTAAELLENLDLTRSDYSFEDTQDVFAGLADFIEGARPVQIYSRVRDWLPVITSLKVLLFGEHAGLNGQREWNAAIETLTDGYDMALRYHYMVTDSLFSTPKEVRTTLGFVEQFLRVILNCHQMSKTGRIPFAHVDRLIVQASERGFMDRLKLTPRAISDTYQKVLINMFDTARRGDMSGADAIERTHVLAVRREFHLFRLNQAFIDTLPYKADGTTDLAAMKAAAPGFPRDAVIAALTTAANEKADLEAGFAKFKSMLAKPRPIAFDNEGRVLIIESYDRTPQTWKSLLRFNVMHALARGMMMGYGGDADPAKGGVTSKMIEKWYDDFGIIGNELKAFDPRSQNAGNRSFQEASFFTYSGNGDDRLDMDEMFEYVSFLFAGGLGNVEKARHVFIDKGCALQQTDVFDLPLFNEACVKATLRSDFSAIFPNLPGLARYVAGLGDAGWERFYSNWITASRTSDPAKGMIETADLRTGTMIFHYSESLFAGNDTNHNGGLSVEETETGATRFLPFMKKVMTDMGYGWATYDGIVREAFVVLVFKGKIPSAGDLASFQAERVSRSLGGTIPDVDRSQIFLVFSNLKSQLGK